MLCGEEEEEKNRIEMKWNSDDDGGGDTAKHVNV